MKTISSNHSTTIIRKNFREVKKTASSVKPNLIENNEFIRIFRISSGTSRSWRNRGFLPFVRISSKVYFRLEDVENFLENHILFNHPVKREKK